MSTPFQSFNTAFSKLHFHVMSTMSIQVFLGFSSTLFPKFQYSSFQVSGPCYFQSFNTAVWLGVLLSSYFQQAQHCTVTSRTSTLSGNRTTSAIFSSQRSEKTCDILSSIWSSSMLPMTHWYCFEGRLEICERWGDQCMVLFKCYSAILNWNWEWWHWSEFFGYWYAMPSQPVWLSWGNTEERKSLSASSNKT